jgi:molybdopterin/thiamine biosynthesis adenylyltransferase
MINFIPRDMLFALLFVMVGFGGGYIAKEYFFTKPCPACICPECPPQNVTNLIINNEKIKAKGGGTIDLNNILKDNKIIQQADSTENTNKQDSKRKGFLKRIFSK